MDVSIDHLRILLVEDSIEALNLVRSMLQELGIHQVFIAKDGREALDFLGDCDDLIDLVVCDWNMPRVSGIDVLRQLRTVDPDCPFIMITGAADEDSILKAKSHGVTAYVRKPFSSNQLAQKLRVAARIIELKTA